MASAKRIHDLELEENMTFQMGEWIFEIIGGLGLLTVLGFALAGALGKDPHSRKIAGTEGNELWAKYETTARWQTRTLLEIHAMPDNADKKAKISINDDYLKDMMVNRITPEPESIETKSEETTFIFRGDERKNPLVVRFHLEPEKPGVKNARIKLGDNHAIHYKQMVLP